MYLTMKRFLAVLIVALLTLPATSEQSSPL